MEDLITSEAEIEKAVSEALEMLDGQWTTILSDKREVHFDKKGAGEYAYSKYTKNMNPRRKSDKLKASLGIKEIVQRAISP